MLVARITYEFLGPVPLEPLIVAGPGRATGAPPPARRGRAALRGRAARAAPARCACGAATSTCRTSRCADGACRSAGPRTPRARPFPPTRGRRAFTAPAWRSAGSTGSYGEPGPATRLVSLRAPACRRRGARSPLRAVAAAADFGNGVSRVLDFAEHLFVNTDLTVHLHREPAGEWVLLDSRTVADELGVGLAQSVAATTSGARSASPRRRSSWRSAERALAARGGAHR